MSGEAKRYFASDGTTRRAATVRGDVVRLEDVGRGEADGTGESRRSGSRDGRIRRLAEDGRFMVVLDDRSAVGFAERRDGRWHVELEGRAYRIRVDDERTHRLRELTGEMGPAAGPRELRAPMPGLVIRVAVAAGDEVGAGAGLVVMEAMKMENELRAERAGIVADVHVEEGATVDRDALLVTFASDVEGT